MRITFVMDGGFSLSGGERVISIYAERLQRRGHDVYVVARPRKPASLRQQAKSLLRGNGWITTPVNTPSHLSNTSAHVRCLESYRRVEEADVPDADIVISTWWETAEWVNRFSAKKGTKVSFWQGYEVFEYTPKNRVDAAWRLPAYKIVVSDWLAEIARKFGDRDFSLVPNGVDHAQFTARPRTRNTAPVVGVLHHTAPSKGFPDAIAAIKRARREFPDLGIITFGASEVPKAVENMTVIIRPPQETIKDIYAQCDVWLCASRSEGFGLPLLEAMACRAPVVSTRVGAATDLIDDGFNGFVVDVGNVDALSERLMQVLRLCPDDWRTMSTNAYETSLQYNWEKSAELFEDALRRAKERDMHLAAARGT
jgi:glycosyltransferase involved in cell wall biosynthesis